MRLRELRRLRLGPWLLGLRWCLQQLLQGHLHQPPGPPSPKGLHEQQRSLPRHMEWQLGQVATYGLS